MEKKRIYLKNTDICGIIINIILSQVFVASFSALVYAFKGDQEKWFARWVFAMVLLGIYGIMKHLSTNFTNEE